MEGKDVFYWFVFSEADYNFSGSQTMAYVMALQQGWPTEHLKFQSEHIGKYCPVLQKFTLNSSQ